MSTSGPYDLRPPAPGKATLLKAPKGTIPPGRCGFKDCNEPRIGGKWKDGGSYMCPTHAVVLLPIRALFDRVSNIARAKAKEINANKQLAELNAEIRDEEERELG